MSRNHLTWDELGRGVCLLLGFIHVMLGVATIAGGPERFPAPSYTAMLDFAGARVWPYGILWIVGGILMFLRTRPVRMIGVGIVVIISNLWASLFAVAAFQDPDAAYTPVAAYGGYGLINAVLFALMWTHLGLHDEEP